jgi:hypothetical protein
VSRPDTGQVASLPAVHPSHEEDTKGDVFLLSLGCAHHSCEEWGRGALGMSLWTQVDGGPEKFENHWCVALPFCQPEASRKVEVSAGVKLVIM